MYDIQIWKSPELSANQFKCGCILTLLLNRWLSWFCKSSLFMKILCHTDENIRFPIEQRSFYNVTGRRERVFHTKTTKFWAVSWQHQQRGCAPSEDSDQPGHPPSLIRVFAVHMKKGWILSYPLNAQRRLWSDWVDAQADRSLCWVHSHFASFVMRWLISYLWGNLMTNNLWAMHVYLQNHRLTLKY